MGEGAAGPAGNRDRQGLQMAHVGWTAIVKMMDWLCEHWDQPEEGIWETRGGRKDFTYGRFQRWVALDRAGPAAADAADGVPVPLRPELGSAALHQDRIGHLERDDLRKLAQMVRAKPPHRTGSPPAPTLADGPAGMFRHNQAPLAPADNVFHPRRSAEVWRGPAGMGRTT